MHTHDDRIQQALNEAKKQELKEKYGAEFHYGEGMLPPAMEEQWLKNIEDFEQQFAAAEQVTVRRFIGDPALRPLGTIPQEELETEIERMMELLRSNGIEISFGRDMSPAEAYRFITEEVLTQQVADIRIPNLTLNFLYDEFHPDLRKEAMWTAEDFFRALFERNGDMMGVLLSVTLATSTDADAPPPDLLRAQIFAFFAEIAAVLDWSAKVTECSMNGDTATVSAAITWSGLASDTLSKVGASGKASLTLERREGFWVILQAALPGIPAAP